MQLALAYAMVIIIWASTPLAIKWSSVGVGFAYALLLRLLVASGVTLLLLAALRLRLPLHPRACRSYLAGGLGLFGTMYCVYWSARYLDSGLVSVLFGLTPLITSLIAAAVLDDEPLRQRHLCGLGLSIAGLVLIFGLGSSRFDLLAWQGMTVMIIGVALYSGSLVWMKQIGDDSAALATTAGTSCVALPLFGLAWWCNSESVDPAFDLRAALAIGYLGVFGSVLGMTFYYYVVKHMAASRVSLITLLTPVLGLLFGHFFNSEPLNLQTGGGASLICLGLAVHQGRLLLTMRRSPRIGLH